MFARDAGPYGMRDGGIFLPRPCNISAQIPTVYIVHSPNYCPLMVSPVTEADYFSCSRSGSEGLRLGRNQGDILFRIYAGHILIFTYFTFMVTATGGRIGQRVRQKAGPKESWFLQKPPLCKTEGPDVFERETIKIAETYTERLTKCISA